MSTWVLYIGVTLVGGGLLAVGGAVLNLDSFMNSPKAEPYVKAYGRTGARLFYIALGLGIIVLGGLLLYFRKAFGN